MARPHAALLFQYRLLLALIFPVLALHAAWLALRQRSGRYFLQRVGYFSRRADDSDLLWLHAASVGEVHAIVPFIAALRARHPATRLLVTTNTVTGAATAQAKLPGVEHRYLPLDRTGGVRRFLNALRPRCALVVETELWPNLYAGCAERAIPVIIVNGRVSSRTLAAPVWVRDLYEECLAGVRAVLARSEEDRACFIALGAPGERVEVIGNIKFAAAPRPDGVVALALPRPYVLAASTREGEEALLLRAWHAAGITSHLLVIAPRHPERRAAILRDLAGHAVAVRSRGELPDDATGIYLADTFGELPAFMAGAELVFMGGSLVPRGGQNLLEPAALGKAIVTGPHTTNFAAETALLLAEAALVQVPDEMELGRRLVALLGDAAQRESMGRRAQQAVESRRDVAERYAEACTRLCGDQR
jgi:3-deoxy-D-manno-octulosonic-acid transferase